MIHEIRDACGITDAPATYADDAVPDEVAADVKAGDGASEGDEEFDLLESQAF